MFLPKDIADISNLHTNSNKSWNTVYIMFAKHFNFKNSKDKQVYSHANYGVATF